MIFPVDFIKVTQGPHNSKAIDLATNNGIYQDVRAAQDGVVHVIDWQANSGGNVIYLKHDDGIISQYGHLSKVYVKKGQRVSLGEIIGKEGATGKVTGPHLHFGLSSPDVNFYHDANLNVFDYCYVYPWQVVDASTKEKYGKELKYYDEIDPDRDNIKYVYDVDDEGLNVRESPNGKKTGKLLTTATKVIVYEEKDGWSRVGHNEWVFSRYLSNKCPIYYVVIGADKEGLNVRNKPALYLSKVLNTIKNGSRVQVYDTDGTWVKVSKEENRWCSKKYLEKIN